MHLIEELESLLAKEESMFRAQLLREDLARLRRLLEMAADHADLESYVKAGTYIGWTNGDMRTHELKDQLGPLLEAMHAYATAGRTEEQDARVREAWDRFHTERLRKLVHCL